MAYSHPIPPTRAAAVQQRLKGVLHDELAAWCKRRQRSRQQFLDELYAFAGVELSMSELQHMLDSRNVRRRIRLDLIPAIAKALDSDRLLDELNRCAGFRAVREQDFADIQLGRNFRALAAAALGGRVA